MPFLIKKYKEDKYKVCKRDEPEKCFSKEGLSKEKAEAQLKVIGMNENAKLKGGGSDIKDKLDKLSIKKLKEIIREYNLHYVIKVSGLKKKDIIEKMVEHLIYEDDKIKSKNPEFTKDIPKSKEIIKEYRKTYNMIMKLEPKLKNAINKEFLDDIKKVLGIA
jgi:hypothetical protein